MKDLNYYKQKLLQFEKELKRSIKDMEEGQLLEPSKDSVGELSIVDNHPADMGDVTYEREKDLGLKDNQEQLLKQVEDALDRMEKGLYGICELCGRRISSERLEAVPYSTVCKECRENYDSLDGFHKRPFNRPVEEDILKPPFGRGFNDGRDFTGFDAEDSWQKVARYGTSSSPSDVGGRTFDQEFVDWDEAQGEVTAEEGISEEDARK